MRYNDIKREVLQYITINHVHWRSYTHISRLSMLHVTICFYIIRDLYNLAYSMWKKSMSRIKRSYNTCNIV